MSNTSLSPKVLSALTELLDEVYPLARDAVIYAEIMTGEFNYVGIAELRDVLEHIRRALNTADEEEALRDLEAAHEHLRRGGVESVQRAATKTYSDALQIIKYPNWVYKVLFLEVADEGRVRELRMIARKKIECGRSRKSNKSEWTDALKDFKDAIESSYEIIDKCPNKTKFRSQLFFIICGCITIISGVYGFIF